MAFLRLFACSSVLASVDSARMTVAKTNATVESSNSAWNQYVAAATQKADDSHRGFQDACKPQMHKNKGGYRGSIMLLHGFTACPQQFEKLVPLLTSQGYTVFTPVLPGHGYRAISTSSGFDDYIEDLPTVEGEYRAFGQEMHQVMQATQGEKVIFGMSLGGGVAAWIGHLGGYDRKMLAAPMILAGGFLNTVITAVNQLPLSRRKVVSWGPGCEDERAGGRAGICHFTAAISAAARNLGQQHLTDAQSEGQKDGDVQIVFVEDDSAVSTDAIINLAIAYGMDKTASNVCGMHAPLPHSFLSPYDNPDVEKYWIEEVTQSVANYLTMGQTLPQDGFSTKGWRGCEIRSTPR